MFKKIKKGISKLMDNMEEKITLAKEAVSHACDIIRGDDVMIKKVAIIVAGLMIGIGITVGGTLYATTLVK